MNTFTVYSPISNTGNNEAQDAVSTVKDFSCHLNEQTGQSMIVIKLHEDDVEIKCTFLAEPIHTLEKEERDQYMKVVCNAALSVFYKTWTTANQKRSGEMPPPPPTSSGKILIKEGDNPIRSAMS